MQKSLPPLHLTILTMLTRLHELGGAGVLKNGVVMAGTPASAIPGDLHGWMALVGRGYLRGEHDLLILTQEGRDKAADIIASRQRVATQL